MDGRLGDGQMDGRTSHHSKDSCIIFTPNDESISLQLRQRQQQRPPQNQKWFWQKIMMLISPSSGAKPGLCARLGCTGHWWYWRAESETPLSYWRGYHRASVEPRAQKDQGVKVDEWKHGVFITSWLTHPRRTSKTVTPSDHQSTSKA